MQSSVSFLKSKPYTFFLGPEKTPITVQGDLFKGVSDPLYKRTPQGGSWRADSDEISDVKWEVFAALVEFAYAGDYHRSIPACSSPKTPNFKEQIKDDASPDQFKKDKNDRKRPFPPSPPAFGPLSRPKIVGIHSGSPPFGTQNLSEEWTRLLFSPSPPRPFRDLVIERRLGPELSALKKAFKAQKPAKRESQQVSRKRDEQYRPHQLKFHAQVCVTADRYLIDDLKQLALLNVYRTLAYSVSTVDEVKHVLDVLRYVYTEVGVAGVPQLRRIVTTWVAANISTVKSSPEFNETLREFAEIGLDLVGLFAERF